jgi:hypothetical protein
MMVISGIRAIPWFGLRSESQLVHLPWIAADEYVLTARQQNGQRMVVVSAIFRFEGHTGIHNVTFVVFLALPTTASIA